MTGYVVLCRYPTLTETVAKYVPAAAGLSEAECLALTAEAKSAAPEYVKTPKQRAEWMRYYVAAKVERR